MVPCSADYWYHMSRSLKALESPEHIGKVAAQRALRRLGARKVKTAQVPVVFDPLVSRSILDHIFEVRERRFDLSRRIFPRGKLGEKVAGDNVTVIDDGTIVGGFGT